MGAQLEGRRAGRHEARPAGQDRCARGERDRVHHRAARRAPRGREGEGRRRRRAGDRGQQDPAGAIRGSAGRRRAGRRRRARPDRRRDRRCPGGHSEHLPDREERADQGHRRAECGRRRGAGHRHHLGHHRKPTVGPQLLRLHGHHHLDSADRARGVPPGAGRRAAGRRGAGRPEGSQELRRRGRRWATGRVHPALVHPRRDRPRGHGLQPRDPRRWAGSDEHRPRG
ncbi:hypothetical protein TPA2_gp36 [Tsukamurella phage TPA2]|uniref:hypothetical protein n=1 Tax=Tsukamurella phage TPA2 TaxID=981330 RepID=UPI0001FF8DBB|nr:hypothetical protein TPA2_gp36 [Tsukamurella phage TPA2]ADX31950.1 hypothetical protein [Tsukamurella phage TPA2]